MPEFWGDVRFGWRLAARSPVFGITAVLLLGFGIGANTLIFSAVDALLLRPLPVKQAERLVRLVEVHPTGFITYDLPSVLYEQLAHAASLDDVLCQGDLDVAFEEGRTIERIRANAVSGNFFSALGMRARIGRVLTEADDTAGAMAAVLSYDFWQRWFGGSAAAVGRTIRLNGSAFTIAGVLAEGANGLNVDTSPDIRVPLRAGRSLVRGAATDPFHQLSLQIFGKLRPGVTPARAEAEIEPLLRPAYEEALLRENPKLAGLPRKEMLDSRLRLEPAGNGISPLRTQFSRGLVLLLAGVGLLLLMACANVACLLLARSAARSQEMGMRLVLGARPGRVARQLLTESLVLAAAGGGLGVALTYAGRPLLLAALPPIRDRAAAVQPLAVHLPVDLRVLGFAIFAILVTTFLCGLWPALQGARLDLTGAVRGSRTASARGAGRNLLVAAQIAICVLLLAGATLLGKTLERMRSMNPGFDRDHIVTFTIDPGLKGYRPEQARLLSRRLLEKTRPLAGVTAAAIAARGLMRGTGFKATFGAAGTPVSRNEFLNSSVNSATPGYFEAMGMRLLAGRDFTWSDDDRQRPRKAIVNQAFVRRFFPGENAIGRLFGNRGPDGLAAAENQIIGVVSDAKYRSLREEIQPTVYHPAAAGFDSVFILHLRTRGQPGALVAPVREALRSLDGELPFVEVRTLREEVETSLWQERLLAGLSGLFACFAALLAGIGLYGALDFAVKSRTREIGVRMALGAGPLRVAGWVTMQTLLPVAAGTMAGLAMYAACGRWIRVALYGVAPTDASGMGAAVGFVAGVALLATIFPTRRAMRIDPASALRHE